MSDHLHELMIEDDRSSWVRLRTLVILRWAAIGGQVAAILIAAGALGLVLPLGPCLALIGLSVLMNLTATVIFPATTRLSERQMTALLLFDTVQLMSLVALTGGLSNPFALLVLAPVTISATALRLRPTLLIAGTAMILATAMIVWHVPLRTAAGLTLIQPPIFLAGMWAALVIGVGFVAAYAWRVSSEIHTMAEALLATQMALAQEQKLTDLGGVVAAAAHELGTPLATIKLTSAELIEELAGHPELIEDARLIRQQADRCRDILRSMGQAGKRDTYVSRAPIAEVVREAAEPHRMRGKLVEIALHAGRDAQGQPTIDRRPEIIHGLRNLVQNAVDFAKSSVRIEIDWSPRTIRVQIADDGPGYPAQMLNRLGDPFLKRREQTDPSRPEYEGMGLGLFIAKTLLRRTGAEIEFLNDEAGALGGGAIVTVEWPAQAFRAAGPAGTNLPITP